MLIPNQDANCAANVRDTRKQFWTRIIVAVIGALTMIVAAYLGRN